MRRRIPAHVPSGATENDQALARSIQRWRSARAAPDSFLCSLRTKNLLRSSSGEQSRNFLLNGAGDTRVPFADVHIHLAANTKLGQIDSWLNRKAGVRNDLALVARLESIHIRPVAVNLSAYAVAGAMHEILLVSGFADDLSRGLVDFPAVNGASASD